MNSFGVLQRNVAVSQPVHRDVDRFALNVPCLLPTIGDDTLANEGWRARDQ
jgi:hypothetical protein